MARMIRKQIYIPKNQDKFLKARARKLKKTESELVREGINSILTSSPMARDLSAWEEERRFIEALARRPARKRRRNWKREDLYDR
jgi:hypothetical protein